MTAKIVAFPPPEADAVGVKSRPSRRKRSGKGSVPAVFVPTRLTPQQIQQFALDCLEYHRRMFEHTGDVEALVLALMETCEKIPPPLWLVNAVIRMLDATLTPRQLKTLNDRKRDQIRWSLVRDARRRGATLEEAYEFASNQLGGTAHAGGFDAMKQSYLRCQRRFGAAFGPEK